MDIGIGTLLFLILALGIALGFECINGFHDTANAVATVIYTHSLKPRVAVVWSGIMNFLGVLLGGVAVAFSIVHLLPVDLLVKIDTGAGIAMVIALLLAAIVWNFGTWYMAIPASSSHTLIGAIIGVGLANSLLVGAFGRGVNWHKAAEVGLSLLISPLIGFALAALLLIMLKKIATNPQLHEPPKGTEPPPWWIRGILIFTCTGVSFAHGSNDGQKGIGLIMLILIGLVPAHYAIDMSASREKFQHLHAAAKDIHDTITDPEVEKEVAKEYAAQLRASSSRFASLSLFESTARAAEGESKVEPDLRLQNPDLPMVQELVESLHNDLDGKEDPESLSAQDRWAIRTKMLMIDHSLGKLHERVVAGLKDDKERILRYNGSRASLRDTIEYAPYWVLLAVAVALGAGTMVGWKRIVVTIGEKIGKSHLTYSQGASAELVAMTTIGMADILGMPVSTTHVLSSGVAGTMAANKTGLQMSTVRSIALAWILTLPAATLLGGVLFLLFRIVV
jgi:PiT family inorganic phosphate transporter